jgi:hypothetical protein
MEEDSVIFRVRIWGRSLCVEVMDADILKLASVSACAERIDKDAWGTCHAAQMDMVA